MADPLLRLPPLDPLRGFVATAQALSFTRAAQALCLTQSALSRQVQNLEESLGVSLFVRGTRSLSLTPEGERLFRLAQAWLREYAGYAAEVRDAGLRPPVTVTAAIGITSLWLLPRLRDFQQRHPDVDVRLATSNRMSDLRREGIDLALRYCASEDAPSGAELLFAENVFPVASPSLGITELNKDNLHGLTLMNYDDSSFPWLGWSDWLAALGLETVRPRALIHFNHYDLLIQAAVAGQGVAIGRAELVSSLIADGRLMRIGSTERQITGRAYWLVQAEPNPREDVARFIDWLREVVAETLKGLEPPAPS